MTTLTEKILGRAAGEAVSAGHYVEVSPDWCFTVDDTIEGAFVPVEHGLDLGASVVTRGAQALSTAM